MSATQFMPMTASFFESPEKESLIVKQAALADHGREVRAAVSMLPPEVSRSLIASYQEPKPVLFKSLEDAIATRELLIEATEQAEPDNDWVSKSATHSRSENAMGEKDAWNTPEWEM